MDEQKTTGGNQEKTFSQAEVNEIINQRLERERGKYADYEALREKAEKYDQAQEAAKTELQKAQDVAADYKAKLDAKEKELAATRAREKVSGETGVPQNLLTADTEEACKAQAEKLLAWRGGARSVPNRSVDHLLGSKTSDKKTDTEAAFAELRDGLFPKN